MGDVKEQRPNTYTGRKEARAGTAERARSDMEANEKVELSYCK